MYKRVIQAYFSTKLLKKKKKDSQNKNFCTYSQKISKKNERIRKQTKQRERKLEKEHENKFQKLRENSLQNKKLTIPTNKKKLKIMCLFQFHNTYSNKIERRKSKNSDKVCVLWVDQKLNFEQNEKQCILYNFITQQQQMIYHRKRLILKRLNHLLKIRRMRGQYEINRKHMELSGKDDDDLNTHMPSIDIPFELIEIMSSKQRKKLRKSYPNLPAYLFMNSEEKADFFVKKSQQYDEKISNILPRESKTKKIVKFSRRFQYKPFIHNEKVNMIPQATTFHENYKPEHFD